MKGATINGVTYEGVAKFLYLGMLISNDNRVQKEIQKHILAGNRTYFAVSLFRNRLLSRATKIQLHKTLIRPIVVYGAETWTMTKKEEQYFLFQTFAMFCMLFVFFWVIPRRLNFISRRFGTLYLFHLHRQEGEYSPSCL
jgi:hypothetical protein